MHGQPLDDSALREVGAGTPFLALIKRSNRPPTAAGIRFLCQQELLMPAEAHAVLDYLAQQGVFFAGDDQRLRDLHAALITASRPTLRIVVDNGDRFSEMPALRVLKAADFD